MNNIQLPPLTQAHVEPTPPKITSSFKCMKQLYQN